MFRFGNPFPLPVKKNSCFPLKVIRESSVDDSHPYVSFSEFDSAGESERKRLVKLVSYRECKHVFQNRQFPSIKREVHEIDDFF